MTTVRFSSERRIVERGKIHATLFAVGDASSDPDVVEIALRNGWAEIVGATPAQPAVPQSAASAARDDAPKPMVAGKARKSPPENK